jgi:hypothetical protein
MRILTEASGKSNISEAAREPQSARTDSPAAPISFHGRLFLFELHAFMALMAHRRVGRVTVMALRALNFAGFREMVVVRILVEVFRPLGNSRERLVTCEACFCGCGRFGLCLTVAGIARETPCFVAVRGNSLLLLGDDSSNPEQGRCGRKANNPSNCPTRHIHPFLIGLNIYNKDASVNFEFRIPFYGRSFPARRRPTRRPKVTQRPWLKPGKTVG